MSTEQNLKSKKGLKIEYMENQVQFDFIKDKTVLRNSVHCKIALYIAFRFYKIFIFCDENIIIQRVSCFVKFKTKIFIVSQNLVIN